MKIVSADRFLVLAVSNLLRRGFLFKEGSSFLITKFDFMLRALIFLFAVFGPTFFSFAQTTVFEADFESAMTADIGTINYNAGTTTTSVATRVPTSSPSDPENGNYVLLIDKNEKGELKTRLDLNSAVDLTTATAKISFDMAAYRTNGVGKTVGVSGYDSSDNLVFIFLLGDTNAFKNGEADRQRPGFQTWIGGRRFLPGPNTPGAFWYGSDASSESFDVSKDGHFELIIRSSSWDISTTNQDGSSTYVATGLPTFEGIEMDDLSYLILENYRGNNFGSYWDNFLVASVPLPEPSTYYFTGSGDGVSLFEKSNWSTNSDGTGAALRAIDSRFVVNQDLVIESAALGEVRGNGDLVLGNGSFVMTSGTLTFASAQGISGGELTISNEATVVASTISESDLKASGRATISLSGPFLNTAVDNTGAFISASSLSVGSHVELSSGTLSLNSHHPIITSTVNFPIDSTGVLKLPMISAGYAMAEILASLTVGGSAAVISGSGKNLSILPDGSGGSLIAFYNGFVDVDADGMDDEWEMGFFQNLSRSGAGDQDNDGLDDLDEYMNGADPINPDSDDDLLTDGAEVFTHRTNPVLADSDGDSNPDGFEIRKNTNPNDSSSKTSRPNILFILADDLGYGDLGVLFQNAKSGKKFKTPFFDQMAADGLILDRHYCPAPVCAPSRGSLLTGMHQGHANVRNNQFDRALEDNHNLATTLKKAGYATSVIGKWGLQGRGHSPALWPAYPTKRGFDYFFGYVGHAAGHTHYPFHRIAPRPPAKLYDQDRMIRDNLVKCFTPDLFTARAKKLIIDEVNDGDQQPFFLYLAYDTPHAALQLPAVEYPGENNSNDLDDSGLGVAGGVQYFGKSNKYINTATGFIDTYRHPNYTSEVDHSWTDVEERFATLVRRMDDNLGDLRKTLEDLGIADETLIVLTSDNGPHAEDYLLEVQTNDGSSYLPNSFSSYGPFEGVKRDCWEGGIREPSLVCWPNSIPAGSITTQRSQFHDWMPTLCELAGVPTPARTDGVSLVPTLLDPLGQGSNGQLDPTTYIEYSSSSFTPGYSSPNRAGAPRKEAQVIFLDNYKGIRVNTLDSDQDFEIYETISDPSEGTNLAGTSGYFEVLQQRMKDRVLQLRMPGKDAARPYDDAEIPVPMTLPPLVQGLDFEAFTGIWPWLPEFENLSPDSTGRFAHGIDLSDLTSTSVDEGLYLSGYLSVPSAGNWTFSLSSDSGAVLKIHDIVAVDDDFNHDGGTVSSTLNLAVGHHPVRIYYYNKTVNAPVLNFRWSGPGVEEEEVPVTAFFAEGLPNPIPMVQDDLLATTSTMKMVNPVTVSPLANDIDDGLPEVLTVKSFSQPTTGGVVTQSGDDLIFTPSLGFFGETTFSYTATDGENFVKGSIQVNVTFDSQDVWLPFQEGGGTATFRANGEKAGSLSSSAVRVLGRHGYALSFNGTDSEFRLSGIGADQIPSGDQARTLMAWVRVPIGESLENQTLFSYGSKADGQRFSFRLNGGGASSSPGAPQQAVRLEVQGGSITGNTPVDDGSWHHVALVCDDFNHNGLLEVEEARIYVDGVLDADPTGGIPASSSSARVINTVPTQGVLGGSNHSKNYSFLGEIDEFRIYPKALTTSEIQTIYSASHQVAEAWHRKYFGMAAIDWTADDDGDGVTRLSEFAFGGHPQVADSVLTAPLCNFDEEGLSFTFRRRDSPRSHDLNYVVETSCDLGAWLLSTGESSQTFLSLSQCLQEVTYKTDKSIDSKGQKSIRVRAEFAP